MSKIFLRHTLTKKFLTFWTQLLDVLHDNNLTQVMNNNIQKDTTLDLLCMTNPSFVNRVETLPPIGVSDYDIVYSEINLALPQNKQKAHTCNTSRSCWCSEASGLLGMTAGVYKGNNKITELRTIL
jgi:hypothetical protein